MTDNFAAMLIGCIEQAIYWDMVETARELSNLGHRLYPDNDRLRRLARVFAPPIVRRVKRKP